MPVIQNIMGVVKADALPQDPSLIDLRFFRRINISDAYNGRDAVYDGVEYSAVLYGNKVVCEFAVYIDQSFHKHRQPNTGSDLYYRMYKVAEIFQKVLRISRAKYFEGNSLECDDELKKGGRWDYLLIPPDELKMFLKHPQYKEMVKNFGLKLKNKDKKDKLWFQVEVSKRYRKSKA